TAAHPDGDPDGFRPEQPLDPYEGPVDPRLGQSRLAPQPLLDAAGRDDLHRLEGQRGDRPAVTARERGTGEPALELPPQPVRGALRGERRGAPPHAAHLRSPLDP